MSLTIKKLSNGLYKASASSPHLKISWATLQPIQARALIKELQERGCHQQDIGDAMYEQDPEWVEKL